ncbi:peptide chain release factor N(5)-glutamine methyltransferase [Thalassotalea mangrovi]|uniref:Release factor glutamine methyltransferase n=1 Tax=Thalassotalea mangrovi TaxID=2572245 RepID=A0A4U1B7U4_9GAMM|nr:peptide chain release factor N(5)-glutamine methyltransferase [Thalassotalea mangrovi]TKB45981.1 peptide chain release factor N(5)-glutamine methyltransferase [Thalassotalea mangrovi]
MAQTLVVAQQHLTEHQVSDSTKLDCQLLLARILDVKPSYLVTWPEQILSDSQLTQFSELLDRRANGEPIAFILGEQEFWSLPFKVATCTLIPRPDTEVLVEEVLNDFPQTSDTRMLDLGTGTGAIALALAHEKPQWQVSAVDFNPDAVALAKCNAERLNLPQVDIHQSDWFANVSKEQGFDLIVSNPPYIAADDPHLAQGDVRFEPASALVADEQGFKDIRHIIATSRTYLKPGGILYLEHGYDQQTQIQAIYAEFGFTNIVTVKDYGGQPRMTKATYL